MCMRYTFLFILFFSGISGFAQDDAMRLIQKVKAKMDRVNYYSATGKMRTDVVFGCITKSPIVLKLIVTAVFRFCLKAA